MENWTIAGYDVVLKCYSIDFGEIMEEHHHFPATFQEGDLVLFGTHYTCAALLTNLMLSIWA